MPPTKENKESKVKKSGSNPNMLNTFAVPVLLMGLLLSAVNLWYMVDQSGSLAGMTAAWDSLRSNFSLRTTPKAPPPPAAAMEPKKEPVVLFSVVKFREGEEARLSTDLLAPLLAHYDAKEDGMLTAILVERKNASSRDVNVRLFFADGSEESYLWPRTHEQDGLWHSEE